MAKKEKSISLENRQIRILIEVLKPIQIDTNDKEFYGKSSARRRFLRLLDEYKNDLDMEVQDLKDKFANKDDKGLLKSVNNLLDFTTENRKKYNKEIEKLFNLVIEIPINEGNDRDLQIVTKLVEGEIKITESKEENKKQDSDLFDYIETVKEVIQALKK